MTAYHLHLVSDSTGETVNSVARACLVQFRSVEPIEHVWSLVRTTGQMDKVLKGVKNFPGPVLFTVVNEDLRQRLIDGCRQLSVPCVAVLDPVIRALASHFELEISGQPGLQHVLDAEYFDRIEAMGFTLAHDDGQLPSNLDTADVVLVGVSRTSKTPTSIYLANRGIKTANVPIVPGCPIPEELLRATTPLIVGLTKDPERLVQVRRNRLRMIGEGVKDGDYVDLEHVREEIAIARKLCQRHGWPIIDVTRRSIEETAATIMNFLARHREMAS